MATPTKPTGTFAEGPKIDRFLVTFYRVAVSNFEIRMVIDVPCLRISLCRCIVYGFFFFLRCMFRIIGNSQLDGQWSKCRNGHCEIDKTTFYAQTRYYTRSFISRSRRVCEYSERATASGARYARVVAFVWIEQHFVILSFVGFWFLVGMTFRLFITF